MSTHERVLGEVRDPDGQLVVLPARVWKGKIAVDHPELRDSLSEVLETVRRPDHIEADSHENRRRFFRRGGGPSRWLMAVVSYEQKPARIITALGNRKDPKGWRP